MQRTVTHKRTNANSTQAERRCVTLSREGRRLSVQPEEAPALFQIALRHHAAVPDADHGYRLSKQQTRVVDQLGEMPWAGIVTVMVYVARRAGYSVQLRGQLPWLPEADICAVRQLGRRCNTHVLDFVGKNAEGLIRYTPGQVETARLIAEIAIAFPNNTLAIVAGAKAAAKQQYRQLRKLVPGVGLATNKHSPGVGERIVVGTFMAMGHSDIDFEKRDLLIVLDAEQGLSENAQLCMLAADARFRLFGLLPTDRKVAPYNAARLMATYGPAEITVPMHGYQPVDVRTVWSEVRVPKLDANLKAFTLKAQGIWKHPIRNRRVGALAKTLHRGDGSLLDGTFPAGSGGFAEGHHWQVVVLTESGDHALAMAKRQRQWPIATSDHVALNRLRSRDAALLAERVLTNAHAPIYVATTEAIANSNLPAPNVVVWAGAGPGLPPLPEHWLVCSCDQQRQLLVVDVVDFHNDTLHHWSDLRRKAYRAAGWLAPGRDRTVERVERFVATHTDKSGVSV